MSPGVLNSLEKMMDMAMDVQKELTSSSVCLMRFQEMAQNFIRTAIRKGSEIVVDDNNELLQQELEATQATATALSVKVQSGKVPIVTSNGFLRFTSSADGRSYAIPAVIDTGATLTCANGHTMMTCLETGEKVKLSDAFNLHQLEMPQKVSSAAGGVNMNFATGSLTVELGDRTAEGRNIYVLEGMPEGFLLIGMHDQEHFGILSGFSGGALCASYESANGKRREIPLRSMALGKQNSYMLFPRAFLSELMYDMGEYKGLHELSSMPVPEEAAGEQPAAGGARALAPPPLDG